jgi:hypothetical protein
MSRRGLFIFFLLFMIGCNTPIDTPPQVKRTGKPDTTWALITQTPTPKVTKSNQAPTATSTPLFSLTPDTSHDTLARRFPSQIQPLSFELLGRPAADRNLSYHHAPWDLQLWHDRIYLAHGDWYINSGPLRMLYYDLNTGEFIHEDSYILNEQGMEIFRVFDDILYLPGV